MNKGSVNNLFGRSAAAAVLLAAFVGLMLSPATAEDVDNSEKIDNTRAALEKWVETKRMISKEKRDWALEREILAERIDLVTGEIKGLKEKINQANSSITEQDTNRQKEVDKNEKLKKASESLKETLLKLEARSLELLKRLPSPIVDRVKPLTQSIPLAGQSSELSMAQRFQNVIGMLDQVNKFNREITVTSELRKLEDGSSAEVACVYVGISYAYYVNNDATLAGIGTSGKDSWVWTPANSHAKEISDVIAILKNEQVAAYVKLPVEIK